MNQLVITAVLGSVKGYSQVILGRESFAQILGQNPVLAVLEDGVTESGAIRRKFDFGGVELWSEYEPAKRKSVIRIKDADAKRLFTKKALLAAPYDA